MSGLRSSLVVASGTATSRVLGFVRTLLLAAAIGLGGSQVAVAFGLANQLPNTIFLLVAGGVLNSVLVPQIVRSLRVDRDGGALVRKLLTLVGTLALVLTVATTLCAAPLVDLFARSSVDGGPGLDADTVALAVALALWCLPQLWFLVASALLGEVLNATGRFAGAAWAPVVNNVVAIGGVIALMVVFGPGRTDAAGWSPLQVAVLGGSATLGLVAQALVLMVLFARSGIGFRLDFRWRDASLGRIGRSGLWVAGVAVIALVKSIVQLNVASLAGEDGANVASLQTAWYVFSLPHAIVSVSIVVVVFTTLSEQAAREDLAGMRRSLARAIRLIAVALTILGACLMVLAMPFARAYERDFDQAVGLALVIAVLGVCLVAYGVEHVLLRVVYAFGDTRTPFLWGLVGLVISLTLLGLASLLPSAWIVAGIAAAITTANLISCTVWCVLVRRRIGPFGLRALARAQLQHLLAAAVAAGVGVLAAWALGSYEPGGFAVREAWTALLVCALVGTLMLAVYAGALRLMRAPSLDELLRLLRRR